MKEVYPERADRAWREWDKQETASPWAAQTTIAEPEEFAKRFGFAPNAVQQAAMEAANTMDAPGILILEAQMGVGKTGGGAGGRGNSGGAVWRGRHFLWLAHAGNGKRAFSAFAAMGRKSA